MCDGFAFNVNYFSHSQILELIYMLDLVQNLALVEKIFKKRVCDWQLGEIYQYSIYSSRFGNCSV